jgi:Domain of unknown function (DUF222)/HNH endonuclease
MCDRGQQPMPGSAGPAGQPASGSAALAGQPAPAWAAPAGAADAVAMARAGLEWLAGADAAGLTTAEQAGCLRALERTESSLTAARASVLSAFTAQGGYQDDGHGSVKMWLRWQTRITRAAAAGAMGWMRRLAAHRAIAGALAGGQLSSSWARQLCAWSDLLPAHARPDADAILIAAALAGAELADLARLAEEIRARTAGPDRDDDDDGFAGRGLQLGVTYGGAGKLTGNLTPGCAAALSAVLEALGKKAGPEDNRTKWQRDHDALEEGCRRLIGAGCLPERAGQPTQVQLHITLDQLRGLPGAPETQAAWAGGRWPAAGPGADCDATIVPVVCGHLDPEILDQLAATLLRRDPAASATAHHAASGVGQPGYLGQPGRAPGAQGWPGLADAADSAATARDGRAQRAAARLIAAHAADLLSGPSGLAAFLRTGLLTGPAAAISLPLDVGAATETIPAHLRRAVIARDRHCRFPGCEQSPAASQVHHLIPRSEGGPTALTNLLMLCAFHHLIAIHRWGWSITLHPDGTVTATSPDRARTLHSHSPPATAA